MKKGRMVLIIFMGVVILSKNVSAYLFPVTGAQLIGSLWPLIVALFMTVSAFLVKIFWKPIKKGASKIIMKGNKKEQTSNEGEETLLKSQKLP